MSHRLVLLMVAASVALAGCASPDDTGSPGTTPTSGATPTGGASPTPGGTPSTPGSGSGMTFTTAEASCDNVPHDDGATPTSRGGTVSTSEAEGLLRQAMTGMEEAYDMRMTAEPEDGETMHIVGSFSPDGATFMLMCGLPMEAEQSGFPYEAAALYSVDGKSAWITGDMVTVVASDEDDSDADDFADIGRPEKLFNLEGNESLQVASARPVTFRGADAVEMDIEATNEDGERDTGKAIVMVDGPALARLQMQGDGSDSGDPFANALVTLDFLERGTLGIETPQFVVRAMGLGYKSDDNPYDFTSGDDEEGPHNETWTFWGDANVPLSEVLVLVKAPSDDGDDPFGGPTFENVTDRETLWSFRLSDGAKTEGNLTLSFVDADANGEVSPGDKLVILDTSGEQPKLVLYDEKTGTHVVPAPAFALVLGALALLAVAMRRRA